MRGNVDHGSVSSSGKVYIDGDILGKFSASSSAKLSATSITGSVSASSSAKVHSSLSSDCDNVKTSSSGKCKVSDIDEVTVEIDEQPFTLEGTDKCNWWKYGLIIAASSVSLLVIVCLLACCWWKRRHSAGRSDKDGLAVVLLPAAAAAAGHSDKETAAENGHDIVATDTAGTADRPSIQKPAFAHSVVIPLDKESATDAVAVPFVDTTSSAKKDENLVDPAATNIV
jgi:hypothetical protein